MTKEEYANHLREVKAKAIEAQKSGKPEEYFWLPDIGEYFMVSIGFDMDHYNSETEINFIVGDEVVWDVMDEDCPYVCYMGAEKNYFTNGQGYCFIDALTNCSFQLCSSTCLLTYDSLWDWSNEKYVGLARRTA